MNSTGLAGESTGADSDLARVSFMSENLALLGDANELAGSPRIWLRLSSPAPIVDTADFLFSLLSGIGVDGLG